MRDTFADEGPSAETLANLQAHPDNQVILNAETEADADAAFTNPLDYCHTSSQQASTSAPIEASEHYEVYPNDSNGFKSTFTEQCQKFLTETINYADQIAPLLPAFSANITTFIEVMVAPTIDIKKAISSLNELAGTAEIYVAAVKALKELEDTHMKWWSNYRTLDLTANQIKEVLDWGTALQSGREGESESVMDRAIWGRSVAWKKPILTRRTGMELRPFLQVVWQMLKIWVKHVKHEAAAVVLMWFSLPCGFPHD